MRILLINRVHFIQGGADRVYFNTGKLLENNGHEVAYFSSLNDENEKSDYESYFVDGFKTRHISFLKKMTVSKNYLFNKKTVISLEKLLVEFKPEVAHVHLFYGTLSVSVLTTLNRFRIPIVLTIHDYRLLCPVNAMLDNDSQICEKCFGGRYYNCVFKKCSQGNLFQSTIVTVEAYMRKYFYDPLQLVNHFIFVSKFSMFKHISFDKRYEGKSSLIYNFSTSSSNYKISRGKYLLFYGRLSREKGILTLLKAVINSEYKLLIAGEGPLRRDIEQYSSNYENIDFVGFKTGPELEALILNCSFVIVPSEWYENNPMTIVESFMLGKPVIAANIGGIPELIDKQRGFLFESQSVDSLKNVIHSALNIDDQTYYNLSDKCRNFALEVFNDKKHLKELTKIYNSVIHNAKVIN